MKNLISCFAKEKGIIHLKIKKNIYNLYIYNIYIIWIEYKKK